MTEFAWQIKLINSNQFKAAQLSCLISDTTLFIRGISFSHNKIAILFNKWSGIFNDEIHLANCTSEHDAKLRCMLGRIGLTAVMDGSDRIEPKLGNKRINCIDLLANRIEKNSFATSVDSERNTWESCTGPHIKKTLRLNRKVPCQ